MLGMIDWGIGGVSIYKLIKERSPESAVLYFSDTGATPYGKMKRGELAERLDAVIEFLIARGMTQLVIGCNAASTAIPDLADHGIKIEGVIAPAIEATMKLKPSSLGIIGGRRTILSGVYRRAFAARGIKIKQRIAQPLSGLIESGDTSSEKLRSEAKQILSPLKDCSHILLACTHYPAIEPLIKDYVSPSTRFVDPAIAVVARLGRLSALEKGQDQLFTSGDAGQMKASSLAAFGVELSRVKRIEVDLWL